MKISWQDCLKIGFSIFGLYLGIRYWDAFINFIGVVFNASIPIVFGLVVAYALNILMAIYEKHYFPNTKNEFILKTKRAVCMLLAMLTLVGIATLVVWIVIPELILCIQLLAAEIPPIVDKILKSEFVVNTLPQDILANVSNINWQDLFGTLTETLKNGLGNALSTVVSTVSTVGSVIVTTFISIIFSIYFLLDKEHLQKQSLELMDVYLPKKLNFRIRHILAVMNDCFHKYIVGQCVEALILGGLCIVGMMICQLPYAMMIGTLIGFTALIPVAGAYIGASVGAIMILTVSPVKALIFIIFIVVLQQLEGNLIYPKVVGNSLGLPAVWVLIAVTVGGGLMGILGMLLGVPITAAIYRLVVEDVKKKTQTKQIPE